MNIEKLQKLGCRVYVDHFRFSKDTPRKQPQLFKENIKLSKFGGETCVEIVDRSGKSYLGITRCRKTDVFNRKRGFEIALGRAVKARQHGFDLDTFGPYVGDTNGTISEQMLNRFMPLEEV